MFDEFQRQKEVPMAATHCWERLMDTGFCKKAGARSCTYSIYPEDNRNSFGFVPLLLWGAGDGTEGLVPVRQVLYQGSYTPALP